MDLDIQMSDPSFWNDPDKAKQISQEATLLKTEVEGHETLVRKADDLIDYLDMAMEDGDASFAEDIEKQYHDLLKDIEKREVRLLLSGEYDKCNALITFHAGAGGTEAQDWAQMLIRMYTRWAERNGYKLTVLDMQPGDEAGIKSAAFRVEGEYAYGYLKSEKGVHRLVRISPFDAAARRHTSFTAVDVMPELPDDVDVEINMDDVRVDYFRASGAGGQHVNKTDSAVWLRFDYRDSPSLPPLYKEGLERLSDSRVHDGFIQIRVETHRSQDMNRKEAMSRLTELLKKAAWRPKARHATKPTRSSQRKRVDAKKRKGEIKSARGKPGME